MTDPESVLHLRRWQFPKEMEAAFQFDDYQRALPVMRIGLALLIVTMIGQNLIWLGHTHVMPWLLPVVMVMLLVLIGSLLLTLWCDFWRYWQLYFVTLTGIASLV